MNRTTVQLCMSNHKSMTSMNLGDQFMAFHWSCSGIRRSFFTQLTGLRKRSIGVIDLIALPTLKLQLASFTKQRKHLPHHRLDRHNVRKYQQSLHHLINSPDLYVNKMLAGKESIVRRTKSTPCCEVSTRKIRITPASCIHLHADIYRTTSTAWHHLVEELFLSARQAR